jgi:hypothetical protein
MHGRICIGLLVACFLSASITSAQSIEHGRDASGSSVSPAKSRVGSRETNDSERRRAVVSVALSPSSPAAPVVSAPIRAPLPWRPPISSAPPGFAQLARRAGIIFSGTVISIERTSPGISSEAIGTVAITFHVESPIRGATAGEWLTITQWIGLWSSGQRYRTGERLLLFLYPRSRIGLTSCVGAAMGRFAVDSSGVVQLSPQQILAFRTDPVIGGKSRVHLSDFASAVRSAGEEE